MKKYILFLLFIPQLMISQRIKVLYSRINDIPETSFPMNLSPDAIAYLKKKTYSYLLTDKKVSLFYPKEKAEKFVGSDTTIVSPGKRNVKTISVKNITASKIYINKPEKYYIEKVQIFDKEYFIKDRLPEIHWKILPDKKKIKKYTTQKAIANWEGKKIEAWFTKEIPVNAGPRIFQGLPGLILELKIDKLNYKAEKIDFLKKIDPIEPPKHKGKYLTADQYKKMMMIFQKKQTYKLVK